MRLPQLKQVSGVTIWPIYYLFIIMILFSPNPSNSLVIESKFQPEIHKTEIPKNLKNIVYYDDSSNVLMLTGDNKLSLSKDDGSTWTSKLEDISDIYIDSIKKSRALAFTSSKIHYISDDYGENWKTFEISNDQEGNKGSFNFEISVNSKNTDQVILGFFKCDEKFPQSCERVIYYTTNGFNTNPTILVKDVSYCLFTKSNDVFDQGDDSRLLCLKTATDKETGKITKSQVITSTDFFISEPQVINDVDDILANNIALEIKVIQNFIVIKSLSDSSSSSSPSSSSKESSVRLFVSKDGTTFREAHYEGKFEPKMLSFLESTKDSLFISSMGKSETNEMRSVGSVYASDSEGLNFKNILGDIQGSILGFLSFEKFEKLEGAWLANIYEGYDENSYLPKTRSKITFDDGRTWSYLRVNDDENCKGDEECSLNILSLDERRGDGQGATGATPGILLGIGNTGSNLGDDVFAMKTYISRDGGITWTKTLDKSTVFAFGDLGNILVTAPYTQHNITDISSTELDYSLDQGLTWQSFNVDTPVVPYLLTTAIDGSTTKFIYVGFKSDSNGILDEHILYTFDFGKALDRRCDKEDDFEIWYGRTEVNVDKGQCIYGHKDVYKRRKQTADCFINKPYEDLKIEEVSCECSNYDFECNYGFTMNSKGECVEDHKALLKLCSKKDNNGHLKLETKRKIPGNMCEGGSLVNVPIKDIYCDGLQPNDGIVVIPSEFEGAITYYSFLEHSTTSNDETLIIKTSKNQVFISQNGGRDFTKFIPPSSEIDTTVQILEIQTNPYFPNHIYLFSTEKKLFISTNRGYTFDEILLPSELSVLGLTSLTFKEDSADTFIFYGNSKECKDNSFSSQCTSMAFITENNGKTWNDLIADVRTCDFVGARYTESNAHKDLIYCQVINQVSIGSSLIASTDKFVNNKEILYGNIVGFASTTRFTIVAAIHENDSLKAYVTVDGTSFAEAEFPADFQVKKQQAYTILGSETGAVFLHVTSNERPGSEFGGILKSNSNGTSYVLSERYANRNSAGFVDFERVEGLEGIAIVNSVSNYKEAIDGALKNLVTKVTFNDGADWDFLQPPSRDSEGVPYPCVGHSSLNDCSLHLHGYTERTDYRDTFSSSSATGVLLGVGNVGEKLTSYDDAHTFLSSDGGLTWKTVAQRPFQWEFGDQGSIIVIIDNKYPQNWIQYSFNQGQTWEVLNISEEPVKFDDIVTVPSDTSTRFVITTKSLNGDKSQIFTVDFENVFSRDCVLSTNEPNNDDFEYWSPRQPFSSSLCLFGHEVQYLRKLPDRMFCKIGKIKLSDSHKQIRDCACTRRDFECDFNYVKVKDGTCKLVEDGWVKDSSEICKANSKAIEYFQSSGYRKIPMNTCQGGLELDKLNPKACPGHEKQFKEIHGGNISQSGWGLVIMIPSFVFFFAIWFVYDRGIRRNGGFQRFGEIRLGEDYDEDGLIENNTTDKIVNTIVRGGITTVAVFIALYQTAKAIDNTLIDRVKGLFGRGRGREFGYRNIDAQDFRDHEDATAVFTDTNDYEAQDFEIEDEDDDFGDLSGSTNAPVTFSEEAEHQPFRDNTGENDLGDVFENYHDDRNLE